MFWPFKKREEKRVSRVDELNAAGHDVSTHSGLPGPCLKCGFRETVVMSMSNAPIPLCTGKLPVPTVAGVTVVRPGDVVIVSFDANQVSNLAGVTDTIGKALANKFGFEVAVMALDNGARVTVLRGEGGQPKPDYSDKRPD